jgi:hypothetical protein
MGGYSVTSQVRPLQVRAQVVRWMHVQRHSRGA